MARVMAQTWQEALRLLDGLKVKGIARLEGPEVVVIPFETPEGEERSLRIVAVSTVALNGNLIAVVSGLTINLLGPD